MQNKCESQSCIIFFNGTDQGKTARTPISTLVFILQVRSAKEFKMTNKNEILVYSRNNIAYTDSVTVANKFGKRHDDVIRAIENIECSSQFRHRNFAVSKKVQNNKLEYLVYEMTWKGYSFVIMGFTGKKAGKFKEDFIEAFDSMQQVLSIQKQNQGSESWNLTRNNGKLLRKLETDAIERLVGYAVKNKSKSASRYYSLITDMEYKALFYFAEAIEKPNKIRRLLNEMQLIHLATAESIVARIIHKNIDAGVHYKAIYKLCKEEIERFAEMVGVSAVPLSGEPLRIVNEGT